MKTRMHVTVGRAHFLHFICICAMIQMTLIIITFIIDKQYCSNCHSFRRFPGSATTTAAAAPTTTTTTTTAT